MQPLIGNKKVEIYGPNQVPRGEKIIYTLPDGTTQFYQEGDKFIKYDSQVNEDNRTGGAGRWVPYIRGIGRSPDVLLSPNDTALAKQIVGGGQQPQITPSSPQQPIAAAQVQGPSPSRAANATKAVVKGAGIPAGGEVDSARGQSAAALGKRIDLSKQAQDQTSSNGGGRVGSSLPDDATSSPTMMESSAQQQGSSSVARQTRTSYVPNDNDLPQTYVPREQHGGGSRPQQDDNAKSLSSSPSSSSSGKLRIGDLSLTRAQKVLNESKPAAPPQQQPQQQPRSIVAKPKAAIDGDLVVKKEKKSIFVPDVSSFLDKARTLASDKNTVVKGVHPSNKKPNIANIIIIIVGVITLILILLLTRSPPFHARHASSKNVEKFYDKIGSWTPPFPKNKDVPDNYGELIMI